jgi:hypothetical protein
MDRQEIIARLRENEAALRARGVATCIVTITKMWRRPSSGLCFRITFRRCDLRSSKNWRRWREMGLCPRLPVASSRQSL